MAAKEGDRNADTNRQPGGQAPQKPERQAESIQREQVKDGSTDQSRQPRRQPGRMPLPDKGELHA